MNAEPGSITFLSNYGFASATYLSAGNYILTLANPPADHDQLVIEMTPSTFNLGAGEGRSIMWLTDPMNPATIQVIATAYNPGTQTFEQVDYPFSINVFSAPL